MNYARLSFFIAISFFLITIFSYKNVYAADAPKVTGKAWTPEELKKEIQKKIDEQKKPTLNTAISPSPTIGLETPKMGIPNATINKTDNNSNNGSLVNPTKSKAATADGALSGIQSIYQLLRSEADFASGRLDVEQWFKDVLGTAIPNMSLILLGGGECDNSSVWGENRTCEWVLPTDAFLTLNQEHLKGAGLAGLVTSTTDGFAKDMPIPGNMALFYNDIVKKSLIPSAYAQEINVTKADTFFANVVYQIWIITRNIAMTLVAVLLALGALGVLFRQKVSGQAVITIYSLLPYVPVVIFLVLFSYPIMIIAMNVAMILWNAVGGVSLSIAANFAGEGFGDANVQQPAIAIMSGVINGNFNTLIDILPASLASVYMILFIMFMIVAMGIVFIYQYAKVYLKFVAYTIFMPLIMLTALIPGRQWIILYFFKKLMVEILLAPYIITSFFIALALVSTISNTDNQVAQGFSYLSQTLGILVIYVISWGLVWGIGKVRKNLENFFGTGGSIFGLHDAKKS